MSYLDSGFDSFLSRKILPEEELIETLRQLDNEVIVPPSSIETSSVKELSLAKLKGGDQTIGGANNELGRIVVKDNNGTEIVVIDKSGVTNL